MGTFILSYWLLALPAAITGLIMLHMMKQQVEKEKAKKRQRVPIPVKKRIN